MSKWADYLISAVRYNQSHSHIDRVKVHVDNGESVGAATDTMRRDVIDALKSGKTFVSIIKNAQGSWNKGQTVYIVTIKGTEYIKTVDNGKESDNLENLPEY